MELIHRQVRQHLLDARWPVDHGPIHPLSGPEPEVKSPVVLDPFGTPPPIWGSTYEGWSKSNGSELFSHDWVAGDVFGHTPYGPGIQIRWTSPTAGSIDVTSNVWATRDIERFNRWYITLNGNLLAGGVVV